MTMIGARLLSVVRRPAVWIPAAVLAAATVALRCDFGSENLDLALVRPFFSGQPVANDGGKYGFPLRDRQPWRGMYEWGEYPACLLGGGGMVVWMASYFCKKLRRWRDAGIFYALLLIVGPGLLVNCVFKPFWNRPRPHATTAFGGQREFLPVFSQGSAPDSSFPSGHAAMGFYLMAPAFVCWRRRPWLAAMFLLLGLAGGVVMGLARIVAGGHFPSDILWAGGIIYFSALALAAPFRFGQD
jgi:lipid A 4'-phosphatase